MIFFIIVAAFILICVASNYDQKKKEEREEEERRITEEHKKRRLEEEERIARQKRTQERIEQRERQRLFHEEQEKKRMEGEKLFADELSAIPIIEFELAEPQDYLNNKLVLEMDDIKITEPKDGGKRSSFGDFVVIDVETTGLKIQSEIVEISAIRFYDFEPEEAFTTLIKPSKPIPPEATRINHITDEMVENAPTIKQVMPAFIDFVGKSNLLGHNIEFDLRFLYKYGFDFQQYNKRKYYDTLEIARKKLVKFSDSDDFDIKTLDVIDYKLDSICSYFDIYRTSSHNSLSDCYATAKVFSELLSKYDLLTEYDY